MTLDRIFEKLVKKMPINPNWCNPLIFCPKSIDPYHLDFQPVHLWLKDWDNTSLFFQKIYYFYKRGNGETFLSYQPNRKSKLYQKSKFIFYFILFSFLKNNPNRYKLSWYSLKAYSNHKFHWVVIIFLLSLHNYAS